MKTPEDYDELLKVAGCKVIAYERFGSYQGDWIAKVEYEGKIGFIHDYYGSCSGCDALEGEFCYNEQTPLKRVLEFALPYLKEIKSYDEVYMDISKEEYWDSEASKMQLWMEANK